MGVQRLYNSGLNHHNTITGNGIDLGDLTFLRTVMRAKYKGHGGL